MGVCCLVFENDGMLFEFVRNFFNIENKNLIRFFFLISCFLCGGGGGGGKKKWGGGGRALKQIYFLEKLFFLISIHILCYFQHLGQTHF